MDYIYIYLVFSKTGTWLCRLINRITGIKYVHSSISFDETLAEMYSFGRTNPNNPFSGGLVKESLYEGVFKKFGDGECLVYRVKVTEEQFDSIQNEIERFFLEQSKYSYNLIGLVGVLINRPINRKYSYFCSQFVSEVLMKSNVYETDKVPALVKTTDLLSIGNKEQVYEGIINQYEKHSSLYGFKEVSN